MESSETAMRERGRPLLNTSLLCDAAAGWEREKLQRVARLWDGRESKGKPEERAGSGDRWSFGNSHCLQVLLTLQELRSGFG